MPEVIAGAGVTITVIVALPVKPLGSLTVTAKLFVPTSALNGVPVNAPLLLTISQAGPLTFPKLNGSNGFGSVACAAMLAE